MNQLNARVCEIENQVSNLSKSIEDLTNQIEEEEKQFYKKKRNQVTEGNIIALVIGCIFTYFAWVVYDPIGSPVVTLLGVGLPLLSLICRIRREKSHGDRVKKLKLQLKKLQQEWQEALKAREEAYAARVAAMNAKPV